MNIEQLIKLYRPVNEFEVEVDNVNYKILALLSDPMQYVTTVNNITVVFKVTDNGNLEPDVSILVFKDIDKNLLYTIAEKIENYYL